jgi:replicative DNA helicase
MKMRRSLFSADAEQSVIGALLLDPEAFPEVIEAGVSELSFYDTRNALVFRAIWALVEARRPVDTVMVFEWLESQGLLAETGGMSFLGDSADAVPSTKNAGGYAKIVCELEEQRAWYHASQAIAEVMLSDDGGDHNQRMGTVQQLLTTVERDRKSSTLMTMKEGLKAWYAHMEESYNNPEASGLRTGFPHVDRRYGGFQPEEFGVIAGRPGMGKTAFVLNMLRDLSLNQKKNALFVSLEMPTRQLVQRMIAAQGKIKLGLLKSGKVLELTEQAEKLNMAFGQLGQLGDDGQGEILWEDSAGMTVFGLAAMAKRIHRKTPLDVIVVDHIGLVDSTLKTENDTSRMQQVTRQLKRLAKELGCVVIGLSQLNREVEKRANKRPMISDLRGSGSIEQDADWIMLLYRDEYYNEDTLTPGQVEVISGKVRDGEPGTDYLAWEGQYNLLEGMPEDGSSPYIQEQKKNGGFSV